MLEVQDIRRRFEREFWPVAGKFDFLVLTGEEAWESKDLLVARPGVYVWWRDGQVIKVGRHFTNARKRALEHVRDDTGGRMAELKGDPSARLVLLTVEPEDYHWVAAAELYLEVQLKPLVKSNRQG